MNILTKRFIALSLAATFSFGIVSCDKGSSGDAPTPAPSSPSASSSPSATPSAQPSDPAILQGEGVPADTAETELSKAKEAFPDINEDGEEKEKVQLALFNATRYVNSIYDSGYLANGSWVENGADAQELFELYGHNWSDDYRAKNDLLIYDFKNAEDSDARNEAETDLLRKMFFLNSDTLKPADTCNENSVSAPSCLTEPIILSDMSYSKYDDGVILVEAKFSLNIATKKDGKLGAVSMDYDIWLEMTENPYPDVENLRYSWIVDDLGGSWKTNGWTENQ